MKRLLKFVIWLIILTPFVVVGAIALSIEKQPLVSAAVTMTPAQVKRAKELVKQHDPRHAREGEIKSVSLSQAELNLLAGYMLDLVGGSVLLTVQGGWLDMDASVRVPETPLGRYINFRVGLRETEVLPRFRYLELGKVPVPNFIADFMLESALDALYSRPGYEVAEDVVQKVALNDRRLDVTYKWRAELAEAVRSTLVSSADQDRLRVFQHRLADVVGSLGGRCNLEELVQPVFEFAAARAESGDPVADNRAALVVLSAYINGRNLDRLAPDVTDWKKPKRVKVVSHGRDDLPKHFLTSAGLAVTGGTTVSQAIGLFKEVQDSQGGSGFSFSDLLADNAGTRFGEIAVQSRAAAVELQQRLTGALTETDLIPQLQGLPEALSDHEFKRRYGEIGSPAYQKVVNLIDKRIADSRLYN